MRYSILLFVPIVLSAQSSTTDQKLTEILIKEIQQLRLSIERSTLLAARTQLTVGELQLQDAAVARLTQQYNEARSGSEARTVRRNQLTERVQELELKRSAGDPATRGIVELQLKQAKDDLGEATAADQERSARTSELAAQLNVARSAMTDARNRVAELQRALDLAIPQLPKEK